MMVAFVSPAMAASKVSISGHYDAAMAIAENFSGQNLRDENLDDSDDVSFLQQRFRVQPVIQPADGVKGVLRMDLAEAVWGQDQGFTSARAGTGDNDELQVDRAYVDINKGILGLKVGLQFVPVGQTQVFRDNQPAIQLVLKTPVTVRLGYIKVSESIGVGTSNALSEDSDLTEDTDRYLIDLGYKSDAFKINAFYVMQKDDSTDGATNFQDEPNVFGVNVKTKLGPVDFYAEAAQFGGDNGDGVDYVGTQVNANGRMKISDALTLAVDAWYSSAQDDSGTEKKIQYMGNPFARFDLKFGGAMGWDLLTYGRNPFQLNFGARGGPLTGDVFDPFNTGTGCIGAGIGAKFIPVDAWTFIGQLHYMMAEDDDIGITGEFDSAYQLLVAAVYQLTDKTSLHGVYQFIDASFMDDIDPDSAYAASLRLHVAF